MAAHQLQPLPKPIAIFPNFIAKQNETIKLRERMMSLSGDSFHITLYPNDTPILQVQGNAFSLSGRKEVRDMQNNHLFTIRKQHFSIPRTYYAEDPEGNNFFEVQGKFSLGSSKAYGKFQYNAEGQGMKDASLFMKGDFFDTEAEIKDEESGMTVALIDRKFLNARELLGGQQTYVVTVAPGMDMAIICAMCICLDERKNEG